MATPYQKLVIETGDGVPFTYPLASPVARGLALLVDFAAIQAALQILSVALLLTLAGGLDLYYAVVALGQFALSIGYGIYFEWFHQGQTLGKKLLRLQVMDAQGFRLSPVQVVLRNLLRPVDSLPILYLFGGLASLLSSRGQRFGDLAAGTVVIRLLVPREPAYDRLSQEKYNSFREHPHLAARLRQLAGPEESALALQALLRRDTLQPAARLELYRALAGHFRALCPFPETATLGVSDEQYLRNCVDLLYRNPRQKAG